MEFYDVIRLRRSIRSYRPVPVPEDALERIAEAVNMAPTACNRQPFRIIVVKPEDIGTFEFRSRCELRFR